MSSSHLSAVVSDALFGQGIFGRRVRLISANLDRRDISSKIRLRFPTIDSFIHAGLLTQKEYEVLANLHEECETIRWMTPLHWIQQIMREEEEENKPSAALLNSFMTELKVYRQSLRKLFCYDWVCLPLVYTQVAALATYASFFFALFGRQHLIPDINAKNEIDLIIPIFTIVQFLFFVGWFKVGQDLMRPFGLDDDDIELNYILDRNFAISFAIVNRLQTVKLVEPENDQLWNNRERKVGSLPHSIYSCNLSEHRPKLHSYIKIPENDKEEVISCIKSYRKQK